MLYSRVSKLEEVNHGCKCPQRRLADEILRFTRSTDPRVVGINDLIEAVGGKNDWDNFQVTLGYMIKHRELYVVGRDEESQELLLSYWASDSEPFLAKYDLEDGGSVPAISERALTGIIVNQQLEQDTLPLVTKRLREQFPELNLIPAQQIVAEIIAPILLSQMQGYAL